MASPTRAERCPGEALTNQAEREERLRAEFAEAARDPAFLQDVQETMEAFASADAETARMIDDEHPTPAA